MKFGWFCCAWELPKYGLQICFEFKQKWMAFCQSQHEAGGRSIIIQVNLERPLELETYLLSNSQKGKKGAEIGKLLMNLMKKMTVNAQEYIVMLRRFDDIIDHQYGAEYHGYYIDIQSQHATVTARRYDDEDVVSIQKGLNPKDATLVEDVRQIAKELFGIDKLKLLTGNGYHPL